MKKKMMIFICLIFFMPLIVLAYSKEVILGGETLGIEIKNDGVLIVGFYKVNGNYINQQLKIGDKIKEIAGKKVNDVNQMVELIDKNMRDSQVNVLISRDNKEFETKLELSNFNGTYRTGLYVKGDITGIGTLTYIDPQTNIYGALGHVINESKTNRKIEVKEGFTYKSKVTSFIRSSNGNPGSKNADINYKNLFGTLEKNTNYGIFGKVTAGYEEYTKIDVGSIDDVSLGDAYVYTTNLANEVAKYKINILNINKKSNDKNYYFEVVDDDLLKMSGGIVQGMSGSPIIQNNKIIGAVTRVLIDDVKKGYGINIVTMLEEGER